jgi:RarD protein
MSLSTGLTGVRKRIDGGGRSSVYLLLVLQQFLSGGTHIVAKVISRIMDPFSLTLVRSVISMTVMAAIFLVSGRFPRIAREDRALVFWLSFLAIPINQFFFLYGMRYTIPANAALLYATSPVLVLVFSAMFLREHLTRTKIVGAVIAFAGVLIVIFERGVDTSLEYLKGNLLIAIAVVAWALYSVFGKRLIRRYGTIQATGTTLILGTIMFLPFGLVPSLRYPYGELTAGNWLEIGYLSIITSVVSYFLWYYALGKIEAGKVALFTYLQPVITTLLTVFLLGQGITLAFVVGGVLALAGVVLAQFGSVDSASN